MTSPFDKVSGACMSVCKINEMVSGFKEIIKKVFQNNFMISLVIPKCKIFLM